MTESILILILFLRFIIGYVDVHMPNLFTFKDIFIVLFFTGKSYVHENSQNMKQTSSMNTGN